MTDRIRALELSLRSLPTLLPERQCSTSHCSEVAQILARHDPGPVCWRCWVLMHSETSAVNSPEPAPSFSSGPAIWPLVIQEAQEVLANYLLGEQLDELCQIMRERDEIGRAKYGVSLHAHNGRDPFMDALQEALDLTVYLRQAVEEDRSDQRNELYEESLLNLARMFALYRDSTKIPSHPKDRLQIFERHLIWGWVVHDRGNAIQPDGIWPSQVEARDFRAEEYDVDDHEEVDVFPMMFFEGDVQGVVVSEEAEGVEISEAEIESLGPCQLFVERRRRGLELIAVRVFADRWSSQEVMDDESVQRLHQWVHGWKLVHNIDHGNQALPSVALSLSIALCIPVDAAARLLTAQV